jgi:hypothetical protein
LLPQRLISPKRPSATNALELLHDMIASQT